MKSLFYLFVTILLLSCSKNELGNIEIPIEKLNDYLIQGDWVSDPINDKHFYFSILGDKCSYILPNGKFDDFKINFDTLFLKGNYNFEGKTAEYRIKFINKNTLLFTASGGYSINILENIGFYTDTIILHKIKKKNNKKIERISFQSTNCFGECPAMYVQIESDGLFKFQGNSFTDLEGGFKGKLSENLMKKLLNIFNSIELDKNNGIENWGCIDTPGHYIKVSTSDLDTFKILTKCSYDLDTEVRLLIHYLMEMYHFVELDSCELSNKDFDIEMRNAFRPKFILEMEKSKNPIK